MLIADLHIHSKFSRATSPKMNLKQLEDYAVTKGVDILGTGDFTHPTWLENIKNTLEPGSNGFLKSSEGNVDWVLTAEVSNIYSQSGDLRKIHHVLIAPSVEVVEQINDQLDPRGKLEADGRPIFGKMSAPELVEIVMSVSKDCLVIPAHIWTPWFSLFGSKSGFDRIEDCYQDQLKHIHALETGLSSDPSMNWRLSALDDYTLLSNSDCHSPYCWRLGREANVMNVSGYGDMIKTIRSKDSDKFLYTIEVDPNYGKYHYDGHRSCGVRLSPVRSEEINNLCPECGRPLTIGVLHRVEELADQPEGRVPDNAIPFKRIIPLSELISVVSGVGVSTKTVARQFDKLVKPLGSEYNVLLKASRESLLESAPEKLVELILRNREGGIKVSPGFDGVYGEPVIEGREPLKSALQVSGREKKGQRTLNEY